MFTKVHFHLSLCRVEGGDRENCSDVVDSGKKNLKKDRDGARIYETGKGK